MKEISSFVPRQSIGDLSDLDSSQSLDNPRGMKQITSDRPRGGDVPSRLDLGLPESSKSEESDGARSVRAALDNLDTALKSKKSYSRFKNFVAEKLPFVGKTSYGKVMDQTRAFLGQADGLSPAERLKGLAKLESAVAAWQSKHPGASSKQDAMADLRESLKAEMVVARDDIRKADATKPKGSGPSLDTLRDDAIDKVGKEFQAQTKNGTQPLNERTLFRTNSDATKALKAHLEAAFPPSYRDSIAERALDLTGGVSPGTHKARPAHNQPLQDTLNRSLSQLDGSKLKEFQGLADEMLLHLMGGKDFESINDRVDELPDEVIALLGQLDAEIDAASGGDPEARRNGVIGTLFLRFATPTLVNLNSPGLLAATSEEQRNACNLLSQLVQMAVNQGSDEQVMQKVQEGLKDDLLSWTRSYEAPLLQFVEALLERAGRPGLDG